MITRGRFGLLVAAVVVLAAVALWVERPDEARGTAADGQRLFPALLDRVNDVARVSLRGPDTTATLRRQGERWTLDELAGYPAKFGEVKALVVAVADLEPLEAKTANPELWPRLGVQGPDAAPAEASDEDTAPSTEVELADADGDVLASVVVGKTRPGQPPALYVRRADDDQAWLARGELRPPATKTSWVDREVIHVAADRLERVEIVHPDGERVSVSRPDADTRDWSVDERPEGREPRYENAAMGPANALTRLNLDDVRRADDFTWPDDGVTTGRYEAFDGLIVTTRLADVDGHTWLALAAQAAPAPPAAREADDTGGAEDDATPDAAEVQTEAESDGESAAAARKREKLLTEVASLNERLAPWVFAVPEWKAAALRQHLEDLLKPVEAPAADGAGEAGAPPDDDA